MYLAFYGLEREPFQLNPDPRFLHLAAPHRKALETMLEAVSLRKALQVAVGPVGTGKTTLLYCLQHILLHEASRERPVRTAFIVNPVLTASELFEMLLDDLEISTSAKTKPASLRLLQDLLSQEYARNGRIVLIIDEAHLMPVALLEEIRLLLNLDHYSSNVLQVMLCGQPELVSLLVKPECAAIRQRVAEFSKLRPLALEETRDYIVERLRTAGLRDEGPFTQAAFEDIQRRSGGVPRMINMICDRTLASGYRRQVRKISPDLVREAADELKSLHTTLHVIDSPADDVTSILAPSNG